MTALMPVCSTAAASAIARPRMPDEAQGVLFAQDAGGRGRGELADRVSGDAGDAVAVGSAFHDSRLAATMSG